jgi:hypothetical protein
VLVSTHEWKRKRATPRPMTMAAPRREESYYEEEAEFVAT